MSARLDGLPFDLLYTVASYGGIEELVHLANTCRQLRYLLFEESLARKIVERFAKDTFEAKDAPTIGYSNAIRRIYKRRKAIREGCPASVCVVGYGLDALYGDSHTCILTEDGVQIVDLFGHNGRHTIKLRDLLGPLIRSGIDCESGSIHLLAITAHALAYRFDTGNGQNWLLAVDFSRPGRPRHLVRRPERLLSVNKIFVVMDENVLFYGTHSAVAEICGQRHREWIIQGLSISKKRFDIADEDGELHPSIRSEPIRLHRFAGSHAGVTASFKLHQGYLYALTNCDAFEIIEVDFTSFYHVIRFPIANPLQDSCQAARRIYRRQHIEGPVNDGWQSLDLQTDEDSNDLLIVESRAEWPNAVSKLSRGTYIEKVDFEQREIEDVEEIPVPTGPANDPLSKIPDDETKYLPTPTLHCWQRHLENSNREVNKAEGLKIPDTKLHHSKHRSYNFACGTALELTTCQKHKDNTNAHMIQLRSYARLARPLIPVPGKIRRHGHASNGLLKSSGAHPQLHGDDNYIYSTIKMWPPVEGRRTRKMSLEPALIHNGTVELKAWSDERSIVYFQVSGGMGKLVCLNFDGQAPVARYADAVMNKISNIRGRSVEQRSDPEHLRKLSPAPNPFETAQFDPEEISKDLLESTRDLDELPDMHQLPTDVLEQWFESFAV